MDQVGNAEIQAQSNSINMMEYFKSKEVTLAWHNLNAILPENKPLNLTGRLFKSSKKPTVSEPSEKQILKNVSGIAKPYEMLAIMGSSGSGKTTLLNVLNFRNRGSLKIQGVIKINGEIVNSVEKIARVSGYVQQDDMFIGTLKVKEHLLFQAMLRMEKSATKEQRVERIKQVMMELNLERCGDLLIGNPERNMKGISGGERRRLAFASEIITNPSILFCDEPTSGLDSFMAMSIVECMKNLAELGKTIIFTIHQPSNDLFEMFDKISFMSEGRMAFIGHRSDVAGFFEAQGFRCPDNYSPPDFFIKTLSISPFERDKCLEVVESIVDAFERSETYENLIEEINQNTLSNFDLSTIDSDRTNQSPKANIFTQIRWLLWRNFMDASRDPIAFRLLFFQTLIMAIIYSLVYLRIENNQEGIQNINGVLFICLMNCSFGTLFSVLMTFPKEIPLFVRETQNGIYRVFPYYVAKVLIELPNYVYANLMFTGIIYWMTNLNTDPVRFLICGGIMVLTSQVALAYGQFISVIFPEKAALTDIAAPVTLPLMIFSGYLLNNDSIPKYFLWIKYLSWFGYANEAVIINQWKGLKNITCDTDPTLCFFEGESVIHYFNMDEDNFGFCVCMLFYLFLGWRVMSYFGLLVKSYQR